MLGGGEGVGGGGGGKKNRKLRYTLQSLNNI